MRIMLAILSLTATTLSYGQQTFESLTDDSSVLKFVTSYGGTLKHGWHQADYDYRHLKGVNKDDSLFVEKLSSTHHLFIDLNGDGRKDLVFNGRLTNHGHRPVVFVTAGKDVQHYILGGGYSFFPHGIGSFTDSLGNYLVVTEIINDHFTTPLHQRTRTDTLRYMAGGFVNYRPAANPSPAFDTIYYRMSSGWNFPGKGLYITADGKIILEKSLFNADTTDGKKPRYELVRTYKQISGSTVDTLQRIVRWSGFQQLPSSFETPNVSDAGTITSRFVFNGGTSKEIVDYGREGDYNLRILYTKLSDLMLRYFPKED